MNPMQLTQAQFKQISSYMEEHVGIKMPEAKKLMIQSRIASHMKKVGFDSFDSYLSYVFSGRNQEELVSMIDVLTTNLTYFFRENQHFEFLTNVAFPECVQAGIKIPQLWSAGCSSGEEPYTLSIVAKEFMRQHPGAFLDYKILATDISTKMLDKSMNAVYSLESLDKMSLEMKKRYFLKSKDASKAVVKVRKEVRDKVEFKRLNFMDKIFTVPPLKQVVFCRNVLIYFDKPTQEQVIKKLLENIVVGGYLILGHSETIFGMDLPITTVAPTVFKKLS